VLVSDGIVNKVHVRRMVWFVGVLLKPLLKQLRDRRCKVGRQTNCQERNFPQTILGE